MPKQSINTLKNWFKRGLKPLEVQFADWLDSYWHKDATDIPVSSVQDLQTILNGFATTAQIEAVLGGVPTAGNTLNKLYNLIVGIGNFAGDHDASGGALPTVGTGASNAIDKGDYWIVSVAGTITGLGTLRAGDVIYARISDALVAADFFAVNAVAGLDLILNSGSPIVARGTINVRNGLSAVDDAVNGWTSLKLGGVVEEDITIDLNGNAIEIIDSSVFPGAGSFRVYANFINMGVEGGFQIDGDAFGFDTPGGVHIGDNTLSGDAMLNIKGTGSNVDYLDIGQNLSTPFASFYRSAGNHFFSLDGTMKLVAAPANDNALSQILARDSVSGDVKYRNSSTFIQQGYNLLNAPLNIDGSLNAHDVLIQDVDSFGVNSKDTAEQIVVAQFGDLGGIYGISLSANAMNVNSNLILLTPRSGDVVSVQSEPAKGLELFNNSISLPFLIVSNGDVQIECSDLILDASAINLPIIPPTNSTLSELLGRNSTTGNVEKRNVLTLIQQGSNALSSDLILTGSHDVIIDVTQTFDVQADAGINLFNFSPSIATTVFSTEGVSLQSNNYGEFVVTNDLILSANSSITLSNLGAALNLGGNIALLETTDSRVKLTDTGMYLSEGLDFTPASLVHIRPNLLDSFLRVDESSGDDVFELGRVSSTTFLKVTTDELSFFGVTPVVRQTGGAATASSSYGGTEQTMLNAVYSAMRSYGLLT